MILNKIIVSLSLGALVSIFGISYASDEGEIACSKLNQKQLKAVLKRYSHLVRVDWPGNNITRYPECKIIYKSKVKHKIQAFNKTDVYYIETTPLKMIGPTLLAGKSVCKFPVIIDSQANDDGYAVKSIKAFDGHMLLCEACPKLWNECKDNRISFEVP